VTTEQDVPPTRLVLVRHGESVVTVNRVIGGPRTCSGLSDLGRRQAEALRRRLAETGEPAPQVVISSAYPRALETARILADPVDVDADFGEHDPGPVCDGMTFGEFVERFGMPDWESDPYAVTFPEGESIAAFHHRVGAALHRTVARHDGRTVMVVCHGGVIDAIVRSALRTPPTGGFELHTLNTSITELVRVRPGRWRLQRYNDAAHLQGLPAATATG
jgi:2,3-bisphosphoglycerate-dependent phosphoglycerate mutase